MRKLKLFFACLLMAVLSIGQVWATTVSFAWTGSQNATTKDITWTSTGICTMVQEQNGAQSAPNGDYISAPRWYKDNKITITAGSNVSTFTSIVITATTESYATALANSAYTRTGGTGTVSASASGTAVTITCTGTVTAFTIVMGGQSRLSGTTTPTINYTAAGSSCTKNVTISKGTPSHGDFTLSKDGVQATCDAAVTVIVTPDPDEHYKATGVTASNGGSVSGPDGEGKYTVTYAKDYNNSSEINVNFTLKDQYTVTWDNNGNTSVTTQVYEGEKPVFPATPAACDATSTTFIGWATEAWTGKIANLDDKTVYTSASAMPAVTADKTYYAVFAKATAGDEEEHDGPSFSRSGTTDTYTSGYTFTHTASSDNSGFYKDRSSGIGDLKLYHESTAMFASTPLRVELTAKIGGGSPKNPLGNNVRAKFLDKDGNEIGNENVVTTKVTAQTGSDFEIEMDLTGITSAYGIMLYHEKETSYNVRYYSFSLKYYTGGATYSDYMTTCAACTHLVDAPELDGTIAVTHNTATINWKTLTNASSYDVTVIRNSDSESIFSGNVNALTKALTGLDPETQYDYSIMGVGDGSTYCTTGNGVLNGSFTTDAAPTAKLYLVQLKDETPIEEGTHTVGVEFDLPTSAATCGKTLVGWTTDTYENYTHATTAPTVLLKKYTFASTDDVTLYAVYANVEEDDETITPSAVAEGDDPHAITINKSGYTLSANKNTGSTAPAWNSGASDVRIYAAGDITLASTSTMTRIVFNLSTQGKKRLAPITASVGTIATQAANDETVTWTGSATSVTFTVGAAADYGSDGSTKAGQLCFSNIDVTVQGEFSNYSTTCVDAPVATPSPAALNDVAVAGASGTITMTYEHVNASGVAVSVWNNEACTEAFEGNWLSATLNDDKNIEYSIAEYNSYASDRSAYIKLTAPETNGATAPAIVKIHVTQVKKDAVFTSLEDLALSDVPANTNVTVSFSNVPIKSIYYYPNNTSEDNRKGVVFDIQKSGQDIKIYYNAKVSEEWVAGGKLSGTLTDCPWKIYGGGWQLAPADWAWSNLTYTAPAAIESLEIRGNATKKTYIDGQAFDHTGLTAWAIYSDTHEEEVTALATWTYDPAKLSEGDTEVEVRAEYNSKSDTKTIDELVVNPIPNKTIAQFIADEGGRCYLEGIVSGNINTTYGNFDLQDETGTIYVYGSDVFEDHGVALGDKVKVIAEEYLLYKKAGNPDKDEALNVVFVSKVSAATIDIDDIVMTEGDELLLSDIVATITPDAAQSATINYEVTAGTAVTISEGKIIASTEGEATITASIEAGEGYLAGSTTFTVTVGPAPEPFDGDYFVKVAANSELTAGEYLIVYEDGSLAFNGGLDQLDATSNYVAVTFDHGKIQGKSDVLAATFTIKLAGTIQSKSGYYIGRTGNSNGMNTSEDEAYTNAISIDNNGNAVILASGGAYMRYNSADNQKRFRYFQSSSYTGQKAIQLYKKENAAPVYETVRTGLTVDKYYTICLDKKVIAFEGASFWNMSKRGTDIAYIEEHTGNLPAGTPYIFQAEAEELKVVYEGAAVGTPVANGALRGTFDPMNQAALNTAATTAGSEIYLLSNNSLVRVTGAYTDNNSLAANRAYIVYNALEEGTPSYAPGKRVRAVPMQGQTATGMENVQGDNVQCTKVLIDGQMYILRGEKMYDATGKLVK